jgi:hypothetical protein
LRQYSSEYGNAYEALNRLAEQVLARDASEASPAGERAEQVRKAKAQYTGGKG